MADMHGERLVYEVVTPREGTAPHPVLLLLHGRGADEHDLLGLAEAVDPRLLILSARAPLPLAGGFMWYAIEGIGIPDQRHLRASLTLIERLLQTAVAEHQGDASRLFALGFSQGAAMAGGLLLTGVQLAGGVMLSGYVPTGAGLDEQPEALKGRPVFVGHGTRDGVIPLSFAHDTRAFFEEHRVRLSYHEYPMAHQISQQELADVDAWLRVRLDGVS